jgi:pimeloyl-ACP methyl ester carboxylesterase
LSRRVIVRQNNNSHASGLDTAYTRDVPHAHVNGLDIAYDSYGSGEPLLLVMGLGSQRLMWHERLCERFVAAGFQVVRFDNRDIGESSWLDHLGTPPTRTNLARSVLRLPIQASYDLTDMADDTAALIEHLGWESAHVVGASLGGMIAQTLALRHGARVRSLTSIMSTPGKRRFFLQRPAGLFKVIAGGPTEREAWTEYWIELFRFLCGPHMAYDEARMRELATEVYAVGLHPLGTARQLAAIMRSGDRTEALQDVDVPTLVIHGTADPLVPPSAGRATAAAIPNARCQLYEGMGHNMPSVIWDRLVSDIAGHAQDAAS